jgi:hypothetical protein
MASRFHPYIMVISLGQAHGNRPDSRGAPVLTTTPCRGLSSIVPIAAFSVFAAAV